METITKDLKKGYFEQLDQVVTDALMYLRGIKIAQGNNDHIRFEITVPLIFDPDKLTLLKQNRKYCDIFLQLLKEFYFTPAESAAIDGIYRFSRYVYPEFKTNHITLTTYVNIDDLGIINFGLLDRSFDLSLFVLKNNLGVIHGQLFECMFKFDSFVGAKSCQDAQEILEILVMECPKYYKKVKWYMDDTLRAKYQHLELVTEFNLV